MSPSPAWASLVAAGYTTSRTPAQAGLELVGGILLNAREDTDTAGLRQPSEASCNVGAFAKDVAVLDHHIAHIDTDTDSIRLFTGTVAFRSPTAWADRLLALANHSNGKPEGCHYLSVQRHIPVSA